MHARIATARAPLVFAALSALWLTVPGCSGKLVYAPPTAPGQGEADWHQVGGGPGGRSFRSPGLEPPLRLLWEQKLDSPPLGDALVSGPLLMQMTKTASFYSFDLRWGRVLGKRDYGEIPGAAPTIAGELAEILVVAEHSPAELLRGVSRLDGSTLWTRATTVYAPALARADTVIFVDGEGSVAALSAVDGRTLWESPGEGGRQSSAPSLLGDTVFVGDSDGLLRALSVTDGETRWQRSLGTSVRTRPAVSTEIVYAGTSAGDVVALSVHDGEEIWRTRLGGLLTPGLALSADALVAGCVDRQVYGLDRESGIVRWRFETGGVVRGTPAATSSVVYTGSSDGFIYALDLESGHLLWKYRLDGPAAEAIVLGPGTLVVTTETGNLYVFGRD